MLNKEESFSIEDYISKYGGDMITFYSGFYDQNKMTNILDIYSHYFKRGELDIIFSKEEVNEYSRRPKLLSKKLYGSTDLWFLILYLNNISHPGDFIINTEVAYKVYDPEYIGVIKTLWDRKINFNNNLE